MPGMDLNKTRVSMVLVATVLGVWAMGSTAHGAEWLIDFGGSSNDPTDGGTWNIIKDTTAISGDSPVGPGTTVLSDSTGSTAANVELQITDDWIDNHGTQATNNITPQSASWVDTDALEDYLLLYTGIGQTSAAFQFNNLNDAWTYTIEYVSARNSPGARDVLVAANGAAPDNFPTGVIDAGENKTVAVWASLTPVNGTITMTFATVGSSDFAYINALRLTETVPEPASLALLGLGGALMWTRRTR